MRDADRDLSSRPQRRDLTDLASNTEEFLELARNGGALQSRDTARSSAPFDKLRMAIKPVAAPRHAGDFNFILSHGYPLAGGGPGCEATTASSVLAITAIGYDTSVHSTRFRPNPADLSLAAAA